MVMIALVVSMVTVSPATANAVVAPADGYGFAQGYTWATGNPADSAREIAAVGKTSASWVRLPLDWGIVGIGPGEYNWGYFDSLVNAASARRMRNR